MNDQHTNLIGRRPVLKGAGVALAGLGGLTGSATAGHGGPSPTPLTDRGADVVVYWSQVGKDENDPDSPADFGFLGPSDPKPPGGITFATHDQADGGLFDFGRIVMSEDHSTLTNGAFLILGGALVKPPFTSYNLIHQGGGLYKSAGQEMDFTANPPGQIKKALGIKGPLPPAFNKIGGTKWHAVGLEFAKLALTDDTPDPSLPEWAVTRIDLYHQKSLEYGLSLLYAIGADDFPDPNLFDSWTDAVPTAFDLIGGGRLEPGSV